MTDTTTSQGCSERVGDHTGFYFHSCGRAVVEGDKCRIHCESAKAKRRAKADARYATKMAHLQRIDDLRSLNRAAKILRDRGEIEAAEACDRAHEAVRASK